MALFLRRYLQLRFAPCRMTQGVFCSMQNNCCCFFFGGCASLIHPTILMRFWKCGLLRAEWHRFFFAPCRMTQGVFLFYINLLKFSCHYKLSVQLNKVSLSLVMSKSSVISELPIPSSKTSLILPSETFLSTFMNFRYCLLLIEVGHFVGKFLSFHLRIGGTKKFFLSFDLLLWHLVPKISGLPKED